MTQYKDKPTLKEDYEYDPELHSAQPAYTIKDSGPAEAIDTRTLPTGHGKPSGFNVIGNTGIDLYEVCPVCDEVLHLYGVKDIITHEKVYRCRNCHAELVKSNVGWVVPQDQIPPSKGRPNDIGFP
jgi:hypothetical protein